MDAICSFVASNPVKRQLADASVGPDMTPIVGLGMLPNMQD
jgi:hypothetical protein